MVGHKLGEFAFTKKRFKYKYAFLSDFPSGFEKLTGLHRLTKNK